MDKKAWIIACIVFTILSVLAKNLSGYIPGGIATVVGVLECYVIVCAVLLKIKYGSNKKEAKKIMEKIEKEKQDAEKQ